MENNINNDYTVDNETQNCSQIPAGPAENNAEDSEESEVTENEANNVCQTKFFNDLKKINK